MDLSSYMINDFIMSAGELDRVCSLFFNAEGEKKVVSKIK